MADENSLGALGPNVVSVEAAGELRYSVQGHHFVPGFRMELRDAVGRTVEDVTLSGVSETAFTLMLPYTTPGPYTLVVINPDGRASTAMFPTPGTSASNAALRADS